MGERIRGKKERETVELFGGFLRERESERSRVLRSEEMGRGRRLGGWSEEMGRRKRWLLLAEIEGEGVASLSGKRSREAGSSMRERGAVFLGRRRGRVGAAVGRESGWLCLCVKNEGKRGAIARAARPRWEGGGGGGGCLLGEMEKGEFAVCWGEGDGGGWSVWWRGRRWSCCCWGEGDGGGCWEMERGGRWNWWGMGRGRRRELECLVERGRGRLLVFLWERKGEAGGWVLGRGREGEAGWVNSGREGEVGAKFIVGERVKLLVFERERDMEWLSPLSFRMKRESEYLLVGL